MKTIFRLFVILLAALVVTGVTWAIGQRSSSGGENSFIRGDRADFFRAEGRSGPSDGEFRERGGRSAAGPLSSRGWLAFAQTLIPMTLIITVVALPTNLWKKRRRARRGDISVLPA